MPSNTHTTATVRLQLDLSGLVTQLRELADTLEAANVKRYDDIPKAADMDDPFGLAAANREAVADFPPGIACDFPCCAPKADDDHEPEPVCTCPETAECRHEAWEVDSRAITRKCADCGAPLPPMPEADDDCTCPETTLADDHEPDIPTACENCNTTYAGCDERLAILGRTCCKPCEVRDTHKTVAWEMWRWQDRQARPNDDPEAAS